MKLNPSEIRVAYWCMSRLTRGCLDKVPRSVADLFNRLDVEYRNVEYNLLSPERHENDSAPDDPRRLKLISAAQAAELLGISERSAQRNYEKLGGQMVSGVCVFDRDAVLKRAGRTSA